MVSSSELVSVIIPAFNASSFIGACVDSVIQQTYSNWECIIVDDGSQDETLELLDKYRDRPQFKIIHHPNNANKGVSKTRNLGIEHSQGTYIAFLDADDVFHPNKLALQVAYMQSNPEVVLTHSNVDFIQDGLDGYFSGFDLGSTPFTYAFREYGNWLQSNPICNSSVLVRANAVKQVEFSIPQLFQFEDWLLWILVSFKGDFHYMPKALVNYRLHAASATSSVMKNSLKLHYSKIEFLLTLFSRIPDIKAHQEIAFEVKETLKKLLNQYAPEMESVYDFKNLNDLFLNAFASYSQEYAQLNLKIDKQSQEIGALKDQIATLQSQSVPNILMSRFKRKIGF
jgi:glycosyltransferase involved in cell wall biosynthesis